MANEYLSTAMLMGEVGIRMNSSAKEKRAQKANTLVVIIAPMPMGKAIYMGIVEIAIYGGRGSFGRKIPIQMDIKQTLTAATI